MFLNQPETNAFNIDPNVYSWAGLPNQQRDSLLANLLPKYTNTLSPGGAVDQAESILAGLPQTTGNYVAQTLRGTKDAITGSFQNLMNNMAHRNMPFSSVMAEGLTNLGKEINRQNATTLGGLAHDTMQKTQISQADLALKNPALLAQGIGLARGSGSPFEPYQAMVNLIGNMM